MRKQLFLAIANKIKTDVAAVRYIDLWNEHLTEVTQMTAWPTPSVFIEFEPYEVHQLAHHVTQADIPVRLHIITRTKSYSAGFTDSRLSDALSYFDLIDSIHQALASLNGQNFTTLMLTDSVTNHNHAELNESIERYVTRVVDTATMRSRQQPTTSPTLDIDASYE
jgi:hypothetical protein